jgi:hypothetical protein
LCDKTNLTVRIETAATADPNSPEVLQLIAEFKATASSRGMVANVKAAAARDSVMTQCMKTPPDVLPEPQVASKTFKKDVVVRSTDNNLMVTYKIKAILEAAVDSMSTAVSVENEGAFTGQLSAMITASGGGVGEISEMERSIAVSTESPTPSPTPSLTKAPTPSRNPSAPESRDPATASPPTHPI